MSTGALQLPKGDPHARSSDSIFRDRVQRGGRFAPEGGRYHLYASLACPWASRCVAVLYLKGLDDAIGLSIVHTTIQRTRPEDPEDLHIGWVFAAPADPAKSSPSGNHLYQSIEYCITRRIFTGHVTGYGSFSCEGCIPDPVHDAKYIRDLYDKSHAASGRYSVPVLWDKKEGTIVNNESAEIIRMLNSEFADFAKTPNLDLYPAELHTEIDEINQWVFSSINMGVYKCGFTQDQATYEAAFQYHLDIFQSAIPSRSRSFQVTKFSVLGGMEGLFAPVEAENLALKLDLFAALDRCESILAKQRYLTGDVFTEADVRLFVTLIRFDHVYVVWAKCNRQFIHQYQHLCNYVRDVYQTPGMSRSVDMGHITRGYFSSHPDLNTYAIVPLGCKHWWLEPHTRAIMSSAKQQTS